MIQSYRLIGSRVDVVDYAQILDLVEDWIHNRDKGRFVIVSNTNNILESHKNPYYKMISDRADLNIPDGMPLVVIGRRRGFPIRRRADGPGLMIEAMRASSRKSWRHFFYGGSQETMDRLVQQVHSRWPGVDVAGGYSPPFRPLTQAEDQEVVERINRANADVLWVGLGCPKQDIWIWEHRDRLNVPVLVGVGLAFDLLAGVKRRAPAWMCNSGLEWLYRLVSEPGRLWKRYLINIPWFIWLFVNEEIGLMGARRRTGVNQ